MTQDDQTKLLDDALARLAEHFDCIQILVSTIENGTTTMRSRGVGNWYARQGMSHAFINSDAAQDAAAQIARAIRPDEEE